MQHSSTAGLVCVQGKWGCAHLFRAMALSHDKLSLLLQALVADVTGYHTAHMTDNRSWDQLSSTALVQSCQQTTAYLLSKARTANNVTKRPEVLRMRRIGQENVL